VRKINLIFVLLFFFVVQLVL